PRDVQSGVDDAPRAAARPLSGARLRGRIACRHSFPGFIHRSSPMTFRLLLSLVALGWAYNASAADPVVLNLWPCKPPGETKELPPEADTTKDTDRLIAGRRIIKLGNVSTPQLAVYRAPK